MRTRLIVIYLIGILSLSSCLRSCNSIVTSVNSSYTPSYDNTVPEWVQGLKTHDLIEISSDNDFITQGWTGNGTASNPFIIEGIIIRAEYSCVMITNTTKYFEIRRCLFTHEEPSMGSGSALLFRNVTNGHVTGCYINETIIGILSLNSTNCQFTNNIVFGNQFYALDFEEYGQDILIANNTIHDVNFGISFNYESTNVTIRDNHIYDCYQGAYLMDAQSCNILHNRILRNNIGIVLTRGSCIIANNSIYGNDATGIHINSGNASNTVYGNFIGWNANHNAQDDSNSTIWDDGLGIGNSWSDYNGSGQYPIPGTSGSYDRWPSVLLDSNLPVVDSPPDLDYEYGSGHHIISWNTSDEFPLTYQILRNGQVIEEGTWASNIITITVDALLPGTYSLMLRLWDAEGNFASDSVSVRVSEASPPTINHPADIEYVAGTVGHNITWTPEDDSPESYEIFMNGTLLSSGEWNGSEIVVSVDGYGIGLYNFTLVVTDVLNQETTDSVFVSVVSPSTEPSGDDFSFVLFLLGVGVLGFVVTFSILYLSTPFIQRFRKKDVLEDKDEISTALDEIKPDPSEAESDTGNLANSDTD